MVAAQHGGQDGRVPEVPGDVVVIGGGPAGLMAAETIATAGVRVTVFDHMPSLGRKFLMAGRGGLNLTHAEPLEALLDRYGPARARLEPALRAFPPAALVAWCEGLGQPTFVGSSRRVFPVAMKASPLLRAWLRRLDDLGVKLQGRTRWTGWDEAGALLFADGATLRPDATVLALGGASWPRLGSDGSWAAALPDGTVASLRPANCGFRVAWSPHLRDRFAGQPLKRIALAFEGRSVLGEALLTATGIEGGAVYALSAIVRDAIAARGPVDVTLDLRPDLDRAALDRMLGGRGSRSVSGALRNAGLSPVAIALVQEALHSGLAPRNPAALVKACPVRLLGPSGLDRAISTAGGVRLAELDAQFMLLRRPGVFLAGEMLDWEAPTGGYLLQASFSTGVAAGHGVLHWLAHG